MIKKALVSFLLQLHPPDSEHQICWMGNVCDPGIHDEERFTIKCEVYKDNGGMPHIVREECHRRGHYQVHEYLLIGISVQIEFLKKICRCHSIIEQFVGIGITVSLLLADNTWV